MAVRLFCFEIGHLLLKIFGDLLSFMELSNSESRYILENMFRLTKNISPLAAAGQMVMAGGQRLVAPGPGGQVLVARPQQPQQTLVRTQAWQIFFVVIIKYFPGADADGAGDGAAAADGWGRADGDPAADGSWAAAAAPVCGSWSSCSWGPEGSDQPARAETGAAGQPDHRASLHSPGGSW